MIGRGDFWAALLVAAGLHMGALALWPEGGASGGSGADGTQTISVAAADASLQALVESWQHSPAAMDDADGLVSPVPSTKPPAPTPLTTVKAAAATALPMVTRPENAPLRAAAPDRMVPPPVVSAETVLASKPRAPDVPALPRMVETAFAAPETPVMETAPPVPHAIAHAPRPDPRPSRPAIAERRAVGTGDGATAGRTTANAAKAVSSKERAAAQAKWAADIQRRIARHQAYPRGTRASGRVQVSMVILQNGSLGEVIVANSSGAALLDKAALRAVQRAAPFPPAPDALTDRWYRVGQWISFERR